MSDRLVIRSIGGNYLYAYLYDDQAAMIKAAYRYGGAGCDFDDTTEALWQPAVDRDGVARSFLGVARFNLARFRAELWVHEMIHAGIEECRRTVKDVGELLVQKGDDFMVKVPGRVAEEIEGEELLAHSIAHLAEQFQVALIQAGYTIGTT